MKKKRLIRRAGGVNLGHDGLDLSMAFISDHCSQRVWGAWLSIHDVEVWMKMYIRLSISKLEPNHLDPASPGKMRWRMKVRKWFESHQLVLYLLDSAGTSYPTAMVWMVISSLWEQWDQQSMVVMLGGGGVKPRWEKLKKKTLDQRLTRWPWWCVEGKVGWKFRYYWTIGKTRCFVFDVSSWKSDQVFIFKDNNICWS